MMRTASCLFNRIFNRSYVLYGLAFCLLQYSLNHKKIIERTLDRYQGSSEEMILVIQKKRPACVDRLWHLLKYYKNLNKVFPHSATSMAAQSYCYHLLKDEKRALEYLKRAIQSEPECLGFYYNEGILLWNQKRLPEAIQAFKKVLQAPMIPTIGYRNPIISPAWLTGSVTEKEKRMNGIQQVIRKSYQGIVVGHE